MWVFFLLLKLQTVFNPQIGYARKSDLSCRSVQSQEDTTQTEQCKILVLHQLTKTHRLLSGSE